MSNAIRPDRVAIYIRWSTEDQGDGTTLEVQRDTCSHFILSQGWIIRKDLIFVDDGFSGGNLNRPALTTLRRAVKDGQVDCVVVFKLDRLSRTVIDTVNLVLEEWEGRCHFKSSREPIDTTTPAGKMFFYLLASFAEWERNVIKDRTWTARLQKANQGFWASGSPPYGYRKNEQKRLVVQEPEAAIVRQIYDLYLRGRTVGDITRQLQAEGAPAPGGPGRWTKPLVRRILDHEIYIGVLKWGETRANPRHGRETGASRRLYPEAPTVCLPGMAPAIVEESDFRRVQQLKAERDIRHSRSSGRAYSSRWLLSAIARCGKCGSSLSVKLHKGGTYPYYYCTGRKLKLNNCDSAMIPITELDGWFAGELRRVYGDHVKRTEALVNLQAEQWRRLESLTASLDALHAVITRLDRERAVVRQRLRSEEISAADYQQFIREIDAELGTHQQQKQLVEAEIAIVQGQDAAADVSERLAAIDLFDSLDTRERKHLIMRLVESLTVYRSPDTGVVDATVQWRIPLVEAAPSKS